MEEADENKIGWSTHYHAIKKPCLYRMCDVRFGGADGPITFKK